MSSVENVGRSIRRKQRDPVPPSFDLPPRGLKAINWLNIAKRELRLRAKTLNQQRSSVIEIIVNNVISIVLGIVSVDITFKLRTNEIIDGLIDEFNTKLLNSWSGPQFRTDSWISIKWEGKNGYYKLCKNWFDQKKSIIAHKYWIPIFDQLLTFIEENISDESKTISVYSCFYAIYSSKIGFPRTRALPLFLDTAMAKNSEIRRYFKSFDPNIHIYRFKEEESEKYNRERKICQAVKQRCIQYIGQTLIDLNSCNDNQVNLEQFEFTIKFNINGQIGRDQQSGITMADNNDTMDRDDAKTEQSAIPISTSSAVSLPSLPSLPPSPPSIPPIPSIPSISTLDNINTGYLRTECDVLSLGYGASRGQMSHVERARYTPFIRPQLLRMYNNNQFELEQECCCNAPTYCNSINNGELFHNISAESASSAISYNSYDSYCSHLSGSSSSTPFIPEYNGYIINNMERPTVWNNAYLSYPQTLQSYGTQYLFN